MSVKVQASVDIHKFDGKILVGGEAKTLFVETEAHDQVTLIVNGSPRVTVSRRDLRAALEACAQVPHG